MSYLQQVMFFLNEFFPWHLFKSQNTPNEIMMGFYIYQKGTCPPHTNKLSPHCMEGHFCILREQKSMKEVKELVQRVRPPLNPAAKLERLNLAGLAWFCRCGLPLLLVLTHLTASFQVGLEINVPSSWWLRKITEASFWAFHSWSSSSWFRGSMAPSVMGCFRQHLIRHACFKARSLWEYKPLIWHLLSSLIFKYTIYYDY